MPTLAKYHKPPENYHISVLSKSSFHVSISAKTSIEKAPYGKKNHMIQLNFKRNKTFPLQTVDGIGHKGILDNKYDIMFAR